MAPYDGYFPVQNDHNDDDQGTVEIVVERQFPVVHLDIRQVMMETDRVEGADQARTHSKQSAPQREVDFSIDSRNVANDYGDTGQDGLPCRFLSVYQITTFCHVCQCCYFMSGIIGMPSDRDI